MVNDSKMSIGAINTIQKMKKDQIKKMKDDFVKRVSNNELDMSVRTKL